MKNKKLGIAVTVMLVTAFLVIVAVIARTAIGSGEKQQDETDPVIQTGNLTVTGEDETDIPAITDVTEHESETTFFPVGDINADVIGANEGNENNNEPEIVGDIVVIPGIKE